MKLPNYKNLETKPFTSDNAPNFEPQHLKTFPFLIFQMIFQT